MTAKLIELDGVKYATGLQWESFNYDGTTRLDSEINLAARNSGKEWGCRILHTNERKQIGFAPKDFKGYVALGAILTRTIKDALYIKRLDNDDFYICYLDEKGLVSSAYEGVVDSTGFINALNTISNTTSELNIVISNEDLESIFDEEDRYNYTIKSFDEIIKNFRKTPEDIIDKVVYENKKVKYIIAGIAVAALAGGGFLAFSKPKPEYEQIVNHELGGVLDQKLLILKKFMDKEQSNIEKEAFINKGKIIVKNKVETSVYGKKEIIDNIQKIYDTYPPILKEWQLSQIRFDKLKNNTDIKFSVIFNRIKDSYGYYSEIEQASREISNSLKPFKVAIYPADVSNNVLIVDIYFKENKSLLQESELEDKISKLATEKTNIQKSTDEVKNTIGEKELDIQENTNFFQKRFGSYVEDTALEIESQVATEVRKIDAFIKNYKQLKTYSIDIPAEYTAGTRLDLLNMSQQTSFYSWTVDTKAQPLPPQGEKESKNKNYDYYASSYEFSISNSDASTKGLGALYNALHLIDKPYYNIYGIQYDMNNEQWLIKGEMYETK